MKYRHLNKVYVDKAVILYNDKKVLVKALGNMNDVKLACLKMGLRIPKNAYMCTVFGCNYVETDERYELDKRSYCGPFSLGE